MKYLLSALILVSVFSLKAQQFQVTREGPDKILKGIITRSDIANDSSFQWFRANQAGYTPNATAVNALKKNNAVQVIAFGGTWCDDTKAILPKFFSILDASGFPESHLTLIGVDRSKKTISHLAEALHVVNVPTFIVLKDGKEIGRVVEYGKTGQWDKELGEVVESAAE